MPGRILLAGLLASTLVFAQRGGGGGRGGADAPYGNFGGTRLDRLTDALTLSRDQKKAKKAGRADAQREATPIHEQLAKSRMASAEAIAAGKSQEEIDQ